MKGRVQVAVMAAGWGGVSGGVDEWVGARAVGGDGLGWGWGGRGAYVAFWGRGPRWR